MIGLRMQWPRGSRTLPPHAIMWRFGRAAGRIEEIEASVRGQHCAATVDRLQCPLRLGLA